MENFTVYAVDKDSIPDHYYICDGYKYFYKCAYNEFTFYIGTKYNTDLNELSFVRSFLDEYNVFKHCITDTDTYIAAENIQNYYHDEYNRFVKYSDCMKITRLYQDNELVIEEMAKEFEKVKVE